MASLQKQKTGKFHIIIFHDGKRFKRSLETTKESFALARKQDIEETLSLIRRKKINVPDGVNFIDFVLSDGELNTPTSESALSPSSTATKLDESQPETLAQLLDEFFDSIPDNSLEENSLGQMGTHRRHLLRLLGGTQKLKKITAKELQIYINKRAKERTHKILDKSVEKEKRERTFVSSATIRKEIVTLGTAWRWGESMGYLTGPLPKRGLRWPKTDEKPPFQTWDEIERQVKEEGLRTSDADLLWDCLYLRLNEIESLLKHVRVHHRFPYVFPMFAMAAYTGARRSELLRSRCTDLDFQANVVTIRELKRVKGKRSTRRVPICDQLRRVMLDWMEIHPGSIWTFSGRLRSDEVGKLTTNQVQNQFNATLEGSRWQTVKGWHCLRHSFISNLASTGIDQRVIDDFVGHTTDEMRRRYRHLFPDVKHKAIAQAFAT